MNKTKLLSALTLGIAATTPLIVAVTGCHKQQKVITNNVIWDTKEKHTAEGKKTVTFEYGCKEVGSNDKISVTIKNQFGPNEIHIADQKFNTSTKKGEVTIQIDIEDDYKSANTEFIATVASTEGNIWSEDIPELHVIYTNHEIRVPVEALKFNTSTKLIEGLNPTTNVDLTLCKQLYIPNKIDSDDVKGIAANAFDTTTSVRLPKVEEIVFDIVPSFETIGDDAFNGFATITKPITIPRSVKSVGARAFKGTKISGLTIEQNVDQNDFTIGDACFEDVKTITGSLEIPKRTSLIGNGAFKGCDGIDGTLTLHPETELSLNAFKDCTNIKLLDLSWFTDVPTDKWKDATSSTSKDGCFENISGSGKEVALLLNEYFTTAGFAGNMVDKLKACSSQDIQFRTDVTTSADDFTYGGNGYITGFKDVTSLQEKSILYIPKWYKPTPTADAQEIKGVAANAFYDSKGPGTSKIPSNLTCLAFANNITSFNKIENNTFAKANFKDQQEVIGGLYLPDSIESVGTGAFMDAVWTTSKDALCELHLPTKLQWVGAQCFRNDDGKSFYLDATTWPEGFIEAGTYAFKGCTLKNNIFIAPTQLLKVDDNAFDMFLDPDAEYPEYAYFDFSAYGLTPPIWSGKNIFGKNFKKGYINIADASETVPWANAWDQWYYQDGFASFLKGTGFDLTDFSFLPVIKDRVSVAANNKNDTVVSFATYGNGTIVSETELESLCELYKYGDKQYKRLMIPKKMTEAGTTLLTKVDANAFDSSKRQIFNEIMLYFPNTYKTFGANLFKGQQMINALDFTSYSYEELMAIEFDPDSLTVSIGNGQIYVSKLIKDDQMESVRAKFKSAYKMGNWNVQKQP